MKTRFFSNETKKYILLFPLCILIGAVVINMLGTDKVDEWGIFNQDFVESAANAKTEFIDVLKYILKKRLGHLLIIFLICFSTIRDKLMLGVTGWFGFTFGIILGALYMQYGLKAIWIFVVAILIHTLIYIFGIGGLWHLSSKPEKKLLSGGYILCFAMLLVGILVESLINWGIFPKIMGFYQ